MEVTLILRDFKTVTGKIVEPDERKKDDCKKDDEKHFDPSKKDEERSEFILLELTRDAESVSLLEVESENTGIEIELANVEFKKGSCILINVADIIYAGINAEIEETEIRID